MLEVAFFEAKQMPTSPPLPGEVPRNAISWKAQMDTSMMRRIAPRSDGWLKRGNGKFFLKKEGEKMAIHHPQMEDFIHDPSASICIHIFFGKGFTYICFAGDYDVIRFFFWSYVPFSGVSAIATVSKHHGPRDAAAQASTLRCHRISPFSHQK